MHDEAVDVSKEEIDQIIDVILKAAINLMQVVGKKMTKEGKGGSIINVSSIGGHRPLRGLLPYSVSKAGLKMATKVFALELGKHKIHVNSLSLACVRTETVEQFGPDIIEQATSSIPIGRVCGVEEVVDAVLLLLSDK